MRNAECSASFCIYEDVVADIGVGVTLWVGVFLNWPFPESVQSDASLTADPHLCLVFNRVVLCSPAAIHLECGVKKKGQTFVV